MRVKGNIEISFFRKEEASSFINGASLVEHVHCQAIKAWAEHPRLAKVPLMFRQTKVMCQYLSMSPDP